MVYEAWKAWVVGRGGPWCGCEDGLGVDAMEWRRCRWRGFWGVEMAQEAWVLGHGGDLGGVEGVVCVGYPDVSLDVAPHDGVVVAAWVRAGEGPLLHVVEGVHGQHHGQGEGVVALWTRVGARLLASSPSFHKGAGSEYHRRRECWSWGG